MAKKRKEISYWPHMILGFLIVGITLSYWTVKSASSIPVQESNEYMMKYQQADLNINEILKRKALFDRDYTIQIEAESQMHKVENSKAHKEQRVVVLKPGKNTFVYQVYTRESKEPAADMNVTFLLTRPHTTHDDIYRENIPYKGGKYVVTDINITKPGRYILQLRAQKGDAVGYSEIPGLLQK
jgi:hypothetical protein